jgi:hypothetical protein
VADLPNAERKRRILHEEKTTDDDLNDLGDRFREAGRLGEAIEAYAKTLDEKRIRSLRDYAIATGEPFVLAQTERLLRDEVPARDWRAVAEQAEADGRLHHARKAYERAGDEEKAASITSRLPTPPAARPEKLEQLGGS